MAENNFRNQEVPKPEIDPVLIKNAYDEAERLMAGVFSEMSTATAEETGIEAYSEGYKEVYFPVGTRDDVTLTQQVAPNYILTQIKIRKQNLDLSDGSRTVLETESLDIDSDQDGQVFGQEFEIERAVIKDEKVISSQLQDHMRTADGKPLDLEIPEHRDRMLEIIKQVADEKAAINRMGPKFDNAKVAEIIGVLKTLDIANRSVIFGSEEVTDIDLSA